MDEIRTGLDLIAQIYAATSGGISWQRAADGLSRALDGAGVVLSMRPPGAPRLLHPIAAGIDPSVGAGHAESFLGWVSRSFDTRRPFARGFEKGPEELGRPTLGYIVDIENSQPLASVVAFRAEGEPGFSEEQRRLANRLVPHLDRAFAMTRTRLAVTRQRLALAEVVDRLPAGILLLSEGGEVVFASRSAMRILSRGDGLSVTNGTLRADDAAVDRTLQRHIADAVSPSPKAEQAKAGGMAVRRADSTDTYTISVSRLLPGRSLRDAVACVIVSDSGAPTEPAVELLRNLHDLTPAEADLVAHLVRGHSLKEVSQARGVSINTTRSQIKQVFHKTGTRRQGELVQLVLRCFLPMVDG